MIHGWSKRLVLMLVCGSALGCEAPGHPRPGPEVPRPQEVLSFAPLYRDNCSGCHGADGHNGAATELANPVYQAIIDDDSLRNIIANGEKGVLMPGFGAKVGGNLTGAQIEVLIRGMRAQWAKPEALAGATPPPWHASSAGDAAHGAAVYAQACARCHGATADQPGAGGSILDGSFLGVTNQQTVRTTVIAGRSDIGQPDWRSVLPGRALTDAEVTDVSAWLIAQTPARPGYPYPNTEPTSEHPGERQPIAITKNPQATNQRR